ncbi:MAG: nuclear transport factor 2 family protein [Acidobacteriota bacterium]|nr:nuclear transport factor 2 family protein [Acidobacteriota bacterium]
MPTLAADRFGKLEGRLNNALRARDRSGLDTLLAKDFELRESGRPAELTLRDDFLGNAAHGSAVACAVEQLMPRLFGDTAVISFVCTSSPSGNARLAVDVWHRTGRDWKLAARYLGATAPRTGEGLIRK